MLFSTPETLSTDDVLDWHSVCQAGLDSERSQALAALDNQEVLAEYLGRVLPIGSTREDINEYFAACALEMDIAALLALVAGIEACIRLDAARRADASASSGKLGGRLSLLFKQANAHWNVGLYDGIMEAWKEQIRNIHEFQPQVAGQYINSIGGLKSVLSIRHWVAHGRYWDLKTSLRSFPPSGVARTIERLRTSLDQFAVTEGWPGFLKTAK